METLFIMLCLFALLLFLVYGILWLVFKFIRKDTGERSFGRNAIIALAVFILSLIGLDLFGINEAEAERDNLLVTNEQLKADNSQLQNGYKKLEIELNELKEEFTALEDENEKNKKTAEDMAVEFSEIEKAAEALEEQKEIFAEEKEELAARIKALEKLLADSQTENESLNSMITNLEKQLTTLPPSSPTESIEAAGPSSDSNSASASPRTVYYDNCTAVRAAGADPIRRGEPGYAKHLDRDGDGVGCE